MVDNVNINEKLTLHKEDIKLADFEVAKVALEHLINLTKIYINNVHKMVNTYAKEFALLDLAMEIGVSMDGGEQVVSSGFGSEANLIMTCLNNVKTFSGQANDDDDETKRG